MDKLNVGMNGDGTLYEKEYRDNRAKNGIAPDRYATEAGFVEVFLEDDDLLCEFPLYAKEFLKHEGANLEEYHDLDYGVGRPPGLNTDGIYLCRKIVSLMYHAAKKGSGYAQGMMVYIYKTYYKSEYNRLKRFKSLSLQGFFDLTVRRDENDESHIRVSYRAVRAIWFNVTIRKTKEELYDGWIIQDVGSTEIL